MVSRLVSLSIVFAAVAGVVVSAEPLTSIPNPRVKDGTWVTDMARALRPDTVAHLNAAIGEANRSHGIEMAVVVVRSLNGQSIEEFAEKLFNLWGIGKQGKDNGLLFLWSTGDRKMRFEVGYGLEGVVPDGKAGAILDNYVVPQFKAGNFDAGVIAGVDAVLAAARNEAVYLLPVATESYEEGDSWWSWLLSQSPVAGALAVGLAAFTAFRRWRRYRPRKCPQCRTRMRRLTDVEDDESLQMGQLKEEQIGSVDYDVWKCASCSYSLTLRYPAWLSKYDKCPQCDNKTKSSAESVTRAATKYSEGSATVLESCAFCSFTNEYTKVLPRITESSSSSGSSGGSSSSFGGGRSGGGGASRGY